MTKTPNSYDKSPKTGGSSVENMTGENSLPSTVITLVSDKKQKQCPKCGLTKPATHFKKKLSMAQSKALLRRPTLRTPLEVTSKNCRACQPKPKETLKTLRNKISDGDIHPIIGELKVKELKQKINSGRSKVMKEYWQNKQDAIIKPWYRNIQKQTLKKQRYHAVQLAKPRDPHLTQHALLDYETAKHHKAQLFLQIKTGKTKHMDLLPHINDYYTPEEKAALVKIKQQIPRAILTTLRGVR